MLFHKVVFLVSVPTSDVVRDIRWRHVPHSWWPGGIPKTSEHTLLVSLEPAEPAAVPERLSPVIVLPNSKCRTGQCLSKT